MTTDTGGPAFPFIDSASPLEHSGMALRDYFAAKAMQGWLATFPRDMAVQDVRKAGIAAFAYEMADDMLKARVL
jgi:hypothetical protein